MASLHSAWSKIRPGGPTTARIDWSLPLEQPQQKELLWPSAPTCHIILFDIKPGKGPWWESRWCPMFKCIFRTSHSKTHTRDVLGGIDCMSHDMLHYIDPMCFYEGPIITVQRYQLLAAAPEDCLWYRCFQLSDWTNQHVQQD